jgi:16S rRNA U1498 N3-methylase RsmE
VADQSAIVEAVTPGGPGVLTKCRNWFVASTCNQYHHIRLPPRVAVGDAISVTFGSSRKEFVFQVARIAIEDHRCTIYSTAQENLEGVDKIDVASCYRIDEGR